MKDPISSYSNAYEEMVTSLLKANSPVVFGNIDAEHAKFIIRSFIDSAKESIEILSGSFCSEFYFDTGLLNYFENSAKKINGENRIRIITMNNVDDKNINDKINQINKDVGKKVISYISCQYDGVEPIKHFMVVDGKRYREEEPHENFGNNIPDKVKASVCCNDPEKSLRLTTLFNVLWSSLVSRSPVHA
jgi:hypothetical protein